MFSLSSLIGFGLTLFAIGLIIYVMTKLRTVVPTNMVHIVQTSGKTTPYGRGFSNGNTYYSWPSWVPKLGISVSKFPTSNFEVRLQNYDAFDKERLPFLVDIIAFFRLEDLIIVSQRVASFDELKTQLHSIVQGAIRRVLASEHLEFILSDRSSLSNSFTEEVQGQLANWGVISIKTIEFMDIRDAAGSTVIHDIKAKKESEIRSQSRIAIATNEQAAETREIEMRRTTDISRQEAEQQVGLRKAEKEQIVGIANEQSRQSVAEQSKITTEKQMDIQLVKESRQAEIEKTVALTKAEQEKQELIIQTQARRDAAVTSAQADKTTTELRTDANNYQIEKAAEAEKNALENKAEGQLIADLKIAEGNLAKAKAEAEGKEAIGKAEAEVASSKGLAATVEPIKLAQEIGNNANYQNYLLQVKQIEANASVGAETAKALEKASIQIIGSGSDNSVSNFVSTQGGLNLSGMITSFAATPVGQSIVNAVTSNSSSD